MWCAAAPRRWARSWISLICARFFWVIVVLIWNSSPALFIASIPASASVNAPGTPRKASCEAASGPSMLTLTRRIPEAISFSATASVTKVPFVARTIRRPLESP